MSADHLTTTPPHKAAAAILAVLAGADLATAAAERGMDPADLADAIQAYHTAGLAALERRTETEWFQVRIHFPDWDNAEATAAVHLAPRLDRLTAAGATTGWWFLRKHPHWRLRLHNAETEAVAQTLNELTGAGVLAGWQPSTYEAETAAFGGPNGMSIVHDLFCADSRGVLDYAMRATPRLGRRELSLLLLNALTHGLDWFERGDMFDRVAQLRPTPTNTDRSRIDNLATNLRPLLTAPIDTDSGLFTADAPGSFATPWVAAYTNAGTQLCDAAARAKLDRGLRAVLAHVAIFHWNRFGLSPITQAVLAHAARTAMLHRS